MGRQNNQAACKVARALLVQLYPEALAAFQAAWRLGLLTQGIGLRPQPWAGISRPVGPVLSDALGDLPPKLQQVPVVVVDGEFPHAVLEVLDRVADLRPVLHLLPEGVDVVAAEVQRAGKRRFFERLVRVGEGEHDRHAVAAQAGPAPLLAQRVALKAEDPGIEIHRALEVLRTQHGGDRLELHEGWSLIPGKEWMPM